MDEIQPQPGREKLLSPILLTTKQEDICRRLDDWHNKYGLKIKPSDMFRGALYTIRAECRSNPDWIAQAANSLRDILYPFGKDIPNKEKALKEYGSVKADESFTQELGRVFGILTELAHHGNGCGSVDYSTYTVADFEKLVVDFERIMDDVLSKQIDVHKNIDSIILIDPRELINE